MPNLRVARATGAAAPAPRPGASFRAPMLMNRTVRLPACGSLGAKQIRRLFVFLVLMFFIIFWGLTYSQMAN